MAWTARRASQVRYRPMIPNLCASRRRGVAVKRSIAAVAISLAVALEAGAQQFPTKPIRLLLPFPTGSGFVIGQVLSDGLRETFKHGVVAEPRSGAGGSLALEAVAKAPPDGHTLLITSPILTITPIVRPTLKLDALRDFTPITL